MNRWLPLALLVACSKPTPHLQVIQDDFDAARTRALENKVPIYVEVFAPW
jgi:hypothetical protein